MVHRLWKHKTTRHARNFAGGTAPMRLRAAPTDVRNIKRELFTASVTAQLQCFLLCAVVKLEGTLKIDFFQGKEER